MDTFEEAFMAGFGEGLEKVAAKGKGGFFAKLLKGAKKGGKKAKSAGKKTLKFARKLPAKAETALAGKGTRGKSTKELFGRVIKGKKGGQKIGRGKAAKALAGRVGVPAGAGAAAAGAGLLGLRAATKD